MRAITIVAAMLALITSGCVNSKIYDPQPKVRLTNKLVAFNLFTENDFSDARWSDSKVQVRLGITRIRQNPYEEKTEYDTTFAWIEFKDLPEATSKIQIEKTISNVNENQESISVSYTYTTSIDGYILSAEKSDFINKWESKKQINIQF